MSKENDSINPKDFDELQGKYEKWATVYNEEQFYFNEYYSFKKKLYEKYGIDITTDYIDMKTGMIVKK